jgi:hypothetical protein
MVDSSQNLYVALSNATQAISKFTQIFPRSGGDFTPINNLSSSAFTQMIPPDANRNSITVVNPSSAAVLIIAPATVGSSGGTFTPTFAKLGGTIPILPYDAVTLSGRVQQGWQGAVTLTSSGGGATGAATIMTQ